MKQSGIPYNLAVTVLVLAVFVVTVSWFQIAGHGAAVAELSPFITITGPCEGQAFNQTTVYVYGITEAGVAVNVYLDNSLAGSTAADPDGTWTYGLGSLSEGIYDIYVTALDSAGNVQVSNTVTFEIDTTPPAVTIKHPLDGSYTNLPSIEGGTEPGATVTIFVYGKQAIVTADTNGYWYYFDDTLPEVSHTVYAVAVDKAGNEGTSPTHSFILDMTRPVVLLTMIPPDVMTRVYWEQKIKVGLSDSSPIDEAKMSEAIILAEVDNVTGLVYGTVSGTVYYNAETKEVILTPDALLKPLTKYMVTVNPLLSDLAGNYVYPRTWSFVTLGDTQTTGPHGSYIDNVNTCGNCHNPHRSDGTKLSGRTNLYAFVVYPLTVQIDDYCNACHDGTVAPVPEKWTLSRKHDFQVSIDGTPGVSSCASCHNPHLTWTAENPNLLQDYYYYEHNDPTNPYLPNSSEEGMCESCHDSTIKDDSRVTYNRYRYEKRHTAAGTPGDYSLCLRCHNGSNAVNIAVYYSQPSRHVLGALDASPLAGHMPCSECHEIHSSNNNKLLREEYGHNYVATGQKFVATGTDWDPATERLFCTRCHNNMTELYGIIVGLDYAIPGHEDQSTEYCHKCHGGSPAAAAHGPQ